MANDYKIEFRDVNNAFWRVWIKDTFSTPNAVVNLKAGGDDPLRIKTVNNAEDKTAPIRAREVDIKFLNENNAVSINTFSGEAPDDRWRVEVEHIADGSIETDTIFIGFLELDDLTEPLQSPVNIVQLKATDKIGSLKDVAHKDFDGKNLFGIHPLIKVIAMALAGTGLQLNINVCSSAKVVTTGGDKNFFEAFVDAKVFAGNNSYRVLETLLAGRFFITQENGAWQIIDVDDMDGTAIPVATYSAIGNYMAASSVNSNKNIPHFIVQPAELVLKRPVKSVKTSYKIELGDLLINQDYRRGNPSAAPLNSVKQETGVIYDSYAKFQLDGWTLKKINRSTGVLSTPNAHAVIERTYLYGSELQRYILIYQLLNEEPQWLDYILENDAKIPVRKGDRVSVSFDLRFAGNTGGDKTALSCMQLLLFANDGKVYAQRQEDANQSFWEDVTTTYNKQYFLKVADIIGWEDIFASYGGVREEYGTKSWVAFSNANKFLPPIAPENGVIKFRFCLFTSEFSKQNLKPGWPNWPSPVLYRNIKIEIKSTAGFVTGLSEGWIYSAENAGNYNNKQEGEIIIDNTTYLYFNGCLLQVDADSNNQYGYKAIGSVKSKAKTFATYGQMVTLGVWNQMNRVFKTVRGSYQVGELPLQKSIFTIGGIDNKKFALLSYDWDAKNAVVDDAVLKEIYDTVIGKEDKAITREMEEPR